MQKELDLTAAKMANDKYNIERLKRKSIQDSNNTKRQRVHGETYKNKKITKKQIKIICGIVAAATIVVIKHVDTLTDYNAVLYNVANDELSVSESIDFLNNYDKPKEHYERYIDALESLDDTEYDFFGNRKEETNNDVIKLDPNTLFQPTEKELDAMMNASEQQVQEYKEYKGAK